MAVAVSTADANTKVLSGSAGVANGDHTLGGVHVPGVAGRETLVGDCERELALARRRGESERSASLSGLKRDEPRPRSGAARPPEADLPLEVEEPPGVRGGGWKNTGPCGE